ncbi:hypothetical protein R0K04_21540, partial [Pseudoalteromonas sp. SIMBA_153]
MSQRFRSDQYQSKIEAIKNSTHQKESHAYDALNAEGKQYDLALTFRSFDNKAVFVHPSQLPTESNSDDDKQVKIPSNHKNSEKLDGSEKVNILGDENTENKESQDST